MPTPAGSTPARSSAARIRYCPQPPRLPAALRPCRSASVRTGESGLTRIAWAAADDRPAPPARSGAPGAAAGNSAHSMA